MMKRKIKKLQKTTILKSSSEIYKLGWKNSKYNWKSLTLLFTSALLASILIFTSLALENLLQNFNTTSVWYLGYGMFETLKSTIIIIGTLTILLMAVSLEYYAIHRLYDYNLLVALGIRKKHLHLLIGLEYGGTLLTALLMGSILGVCITNILQKIILSTFTNITATSVEWVKVFLLTSLICLGIYFFSAILNFEIFLEKDLNNRFGKMGEQHDKLRFQKILIGIGLLLCIAGIFYYKIAKFNEPIFGLLAFFLGLYFIFRILCFQILQKLKNGKHYIKTIFYLNDFYYRYKKNFNYMYILFIFHIIVLFYFVLQIATLLPFEDSEELYPYDYVCLGDETDNTFFDEMANEYDIEMISLEMVRFTVAGGDPTYVGGFSDIYLQGQNIGISNSTYESLTGESLSLTDKEVLAIIQQDISDSYHLLDWDGVSNDLDLHTGLPETYWWAERTKVFYDDYIIVETLRDTIFGYFSYGYQENVVVFSDEAFTNLQVDASESNLTGATMLYLITTTSASEDTISTLMEAYDELHPEYSSFTTAINNVYSTDTLLQNTQSEFLMKLIIYAFLFIFFVLGAPYITLSKTFTEMNELKTKNQLYRCMGMTYKERCKTFYRNLYISSILPILCALFTSFLLLLLVLNMRSVTSEEWSPIRINIFVLWGIYLLVQMIGILVTRYITKRKVIQS